MSAPCTKVFRNCWKKLVVEYPPMVIRASFKERYAKWKNFMIGIFNGAYVIFFFFFFFFFRFSLKSICCWYSFELPQLVKKCIFGHHFLLSCSISFFAELIVTGFYAPCLLKAAVIHIAFCCDVTCVCHKCISLHWHLRQHFSWRSCPGVGQVVRGICVLLVHV